MANVCLFRNSEFSAATSRPSLEAPVQDIHHRRHGTGASQADAVLISSDDESDLDDQSDTRFSPTGEFLEADCKDFESGSIAANCFNPKSSPGCDILTKAAWTWDEANRKDKSSQQQHMHGGVCSPAHPPAPALRQRSSTSPLALQAEENQLVPAGSAAFEAGQASAPKDAMCDHAAEEIFCAIPGAAVESQHESKPGRLTIPLQRDDNANQHLARRDSVGEADSDDEAVPLANPNSGQSGQIGCEVRPSDTPRVYSGDTNEVEIVRQSEQSDGEDNHQRHIGRRKHDDMGPDDDEIDYPPKDKEREQDEEDEEDDTTGPPPRKRRKRSSTRSMLRTASKRQVRAPVAGQRRSGRRSMPSPPSSLTLFDTGDAAEAVSAKFEEWPLENASLKRVTVNGTTTLQLQWCVGPCTNHGHKDHSTGGQRRKSAPKTLSTKRVAATRIAFTPEADDLLVTLKSRKLPWKEIHERFSKAFPQPRRSLGALQVRYCTKLKGGQSSNGSHS